MAISLSEKMVKYPIDDFDFKIPLDRLGTLCRAPLGFSTEGGIRVKMLALKFIFCRATKPSLLFLFFISLRS